MGVITAFKRWWGGVFQKKRIEEVFEIKVAASERMQEYQELWRKFYKGCAPHNTKDVPSLHTASAICSKVAKTVCLEFNWDITGKIETDENYNSTAAESEKAEFLKKQFSDFIDNPVRGLRQLVEKGNAGGQLLFIVANRGENLLVKVFETNCYFPISRGETGILNEVGTHSEAAQNGYIYTLLSVYKYDENTKIFSWKHKAFRRENKNFTGGDSLGYPVLLSSVKDWEGLSEEDKLTECERAFFTEYTSPQNNFIEPNSFCGIPIFAKALDLIRKLDFQKARTEWEFEGGELAIDVPENMYDRDNDFGFNLPRGKERLFRISDVMSDELKPTVFNPQFRNNDLEAGTNAIKRDIEDVCEIARGTISDVSMVAKTATEILALKNETKSTEWDIQKAWTVTLTEIAAIMSMCAETYNLTESKEEYELTLKWGDGVPIDDAVVFAQTLSKLQAHLISPARALSEIDNISLDEAIYRIENEVGGGDLFE
jgi:A118 family predicted phage portal protein